MKIIYSLFFIVSVCLNSFAQVRPYKAIVYDSTITGYYFLGSSKLNSSNKDNSQIILDAKGEVVYFYTLPVAQSPMAFTLHPNGLMSSHFHGVFYLMDSTFTVVDSVHCQNGYVTDAHEFQILPNGHFLLLGVENVIMDLSSYRYFKGSYGSKSADVRCGVIQELDASKNVVFEWHAKDYLSFADVDQFYFNDTANVDWMHCNALDLDNDGNILMSMRNCSEIIKVNRSDSSIIWRFGGKQNQFTFIGDTVPFWGQHDIRRISNGHLTLFDGSFHPNSHGARAVEYELNEKLKTANLKWSYTYDRNMTSMAQGGVQRHQNSNTLVDYGVLLNGRNVCFTVVDSSHNKVFELIFDDTLFSYRAFYYPTLPWKLNRPVITCVDSLDKTYLDAGPAAGNSYLWNNGSTDRMIPVTKADTFFVWVRYGVGVITSEKYIVTDVNDPCGIIMALNNKDKSESEFKVFPNPAIQKINISYTADNTNPSDFSISDIQGKELAKWDIKNESPGEHLISYDVSNFSPGIYFLRLNEKVLKLIKTDR